MNADKCKVMVTQAWNDGTNIEVAESTIEVVHDFWYLDSYISRNSNCDKECQARIRKANSVFDRLKEVWKNKHISLPIKVKLYESLVMAAMQYIAELWPLTVKHMKTLESAHHKFQRRLLGIGWYDRVSNVEIRKRT